MAALALVGAAGCTQAISYSECNTDTDCMKFAAPDGGMVYCTSDHLCVSPLPSERLCPEVAGDKNGALVVASVVNRADDFDLAIEKAFRLAVDEINMVQSGLGEPAIKLLVCDSGGATDQTQRAVQYAVEQLHAVALLGPTASGAVVGVTPYLKDKVIFAISPSATSPALGQPLSDNNLFWRTAPSDALQSTVLANLVAMDTPAPTTVDSLYVNNVYGKGLSDAFVKSFNAKSVTQVMSSYSFMGAMDLPGKVNLLAADGPSHALLIADTDAPLLVQLLDPMKQPGLKNTKFFMSDAAFDPSIFGTSDKPANLGVLSRIRGTAPATPTGTTFSLFQQAYKNRYSMDPASLGFTANAYDATYLLAVAAAYTAGHVPTGGELATGMSHVLSTGPTLTLGADYAKAVQAMAAAGASMSGGVHLEGASGPLTFDPFGDPTTGSFEIWGIDTTGAAPKFTVLQAHAM